MSEKGMDFKHKEVININNGKRLGYVQDVCADLENRNHYRYNSTRREKIKKYVFKLQ